MLHLSPLLLCLNLTPTLPLGLCSDFLPEVTASQLDVVPKWATVTVGACEIAHRGALRQARDAAAVAATGCSGRGSPAAGRNALGEANVLERHGRGDEPTFDV